MRIPTCDSSSTSVSEEGRSSFVVCVRRRRGERSDLQQRAVICMYEKRGRACRCDPGDSEERCALVRPEASTRSCRQTAPFHSH